jgi:hypothetical protein
MVFLYMMCRPFIVMPNAVIPSVVIMLNVAMLSVAMLSVIMLNAVMLCRFAECCYAECVLIVVMLNVVGPMEAMHCQYMRIFQLCFYNIKLCIKSFSNAKYCSEYHLYWLDQGSQTERECSVRLTSLY